MKKITEEHFCDFCGCTLLTTPEFVVPAHHVQVHRPMVYLGSGVFTRQHSEYCSAKCYVSHLAKWVGLKVDSESK